jgi:class 3 adenylate cyclase/pimeloyl-ACP methyl ester carboxylesterase
MGDLRGQVVDRSALVQRPEIRYAQTRDGYNIAYQVVGDGPDLTFQLGWPNQLFALWQHPAIATFFERLSSFSRLILFDRSGGGLSDHRPLEHTFDMWAEDMLAVLDACGSTRCAHLGCHFGGRLALMFAATYPARTTAVVTFGSHPATLRDEDYPWGSRREDFERVVAEASRMPGEARVREIFDSIAPSVAGDAAAQRWWVATYMSGGSPRTAARELRSLVDFDIRRLLSAVQTPTLLMHRLGDRMADIGATRYMAERIPGARMIEVPGDDHVPFFEGADAILADIEEFITGSRRVPEPDRVLATVLFTDIVGSTEHAARMGDKRWTEVLDKHDAVVREEVGRHRGRRVNPTGDGVLATFDGPARAVRCAQAIVESVRPLGIEVRAGLHTGEVELRGEDIGGIAVHIGQRVSALAGPGEVLVSRTVTDLVAGSGLVFDARGERELKGVPGRWAVYALTSEA